jgi:hypothetical protein
MSILAHIFEYSYLYIDARCQVDHNPPHRHKYSRQPNSSADRFVHKFPKPYQCSIYNFQQDSNPTWRHKICLHRAQKVISRQANNRGHTNEYRFDHNKGMDIRQRNSLKCCQRKFECCLEGNMDRLRRTFRSCFRRRS